MTNGNEDLGVGRMAGHPAEGLSGGGPAETETRKVEGDKPEIEFGSHKFKTVEEAVASYENLEKAYGDQSRELGELRALKTSTVARPPSQPKRQLDFKRLGDMIIENPEAGVKEITDYVDGIVQDRVSELSSTITTKQAETGREDKLWDKFFTDNPWLEHRKDEVKLVSYSKILWPEIAGKPPEEQFRKIGDHFREVTDRSATIMNGRELPSRGPAGAASGTPSGVSNSGKPSGNSDRPKTFVDAIREQSYVPKVAGG